MSVTVKWGKESYTVEVSPADGVGALRAQLYSLTRVPPARQKLTCKAWKGVLRDDADLGGAGLTAGTIMLLMGSAEDAAAAGGGAGGGAGAAPVVFVEDLPKSAIVAAGHALPAGLINTGNTCYMNSALEAVRFVPEVKEALADLRVRATAAPAVGRTPSGALGVALAELLTRLDNSHDAIVPGAFTSRLRAAFPQFAEASAAGAYKQQDSEEFQSALMTVRVWLLGDWCDAVVYPPTNHPPTPIPHAEPVRGAEARHQVGDKAAAARRRRRRGAEHH